LPNKADNNMPSLTPDVDQVEAFKSKRTVKEPKAEAGIEVKPRSSTLSIFLTLLMLSAGGAGGWWFYQQDAINRELIEASEQRIRELENQLSATGEEMGESAGAMRARLGTLTKKTDELWEQMDKLWASAWRKNQAEIKRLDSLGKIHTDKISKQEKKHTSTTASLKTVSQKQTDMEFSVGILTEQVEAAKTLKSQLEAMKNDMATLQSKSLSKDDQQIEIASNMNGLLETSKKLEKRIEDLEFRLGKAALKNLPNQ